MMELRKCCNHPFLIKGAEDKIMNDYKVKGEEVSTLHAMVQASGKMVLIHKLLPKLQAGGHKVSRKNIKFRHGISKRTFLDFDFLTNDPSS